MTPLLLGLALAVEGPGDFMPERDFDLTHLDLALTVDVRAGTVTGTATHTLSPLGAPSRRLRLHQQALTIAEVRVDGTAIEGWRTGRGTLDIPMPGDGASHEVAIDYTASPELGLHFRKPGKGSPDTVLEVWSQGQDSDNHYWIPSWDYPNDRFTYSASITAPEGLTVATNGKRTASEPGDEGQTTHSFALEDELPTYLIALVVGDYGVYSEQVGDLTLEYLVPSDVSEEVARTSGGFAAPQVTYFNELLGTDYPWPVYRQAFVQRFMYGGMENTSLTINTDSVLGLGAKDKERAEGLVAHELAHQWFGDLVTCYGWRDRWLNEGFATMYASRWTEQAHGRSYYDDQVHDRMTSAAAYKTPMARRSWSPEGPDSTGVYDRGMMVLHMLRVHLGDEVYDRGIATYVARHEHGFVETADLRRALEDESGEHLGWLFDTWVHGAGVPTIESRWSHEEGVLTVVLSQGEEPWQAPVEIAVGTSDDTLTRKVWLSEGETKLVLDMPDAPLFVAVDPQGGVLAHWSQDQSTSAWIAQAHHGPTPYSRLVAFTALGEETASDEVVRALHEALSEDTAPRFRSKAAKALGSLGTVQAIEALDRGLGDEDERLREASVTALGEMPSSDAAERRLRTALGDSSPLVRAAALTALAKLDSDGALVLARRRVVAKDETRRRAEHSAALGVLGEHGDKSDLARISRFFTNDSHGRLVGAATRAAVARVQELDDKARDKARELASRQLETMLYDDDFRLRMSAIAGLGDLGDAQARAALLALASDTTVDRLAERARTAASKIANRSDAPPDPEAKEDAEVLEQRIDELEERLDKLEKWR